MDLTPWLVVIHILSVFGFLAVHGINMGVLLRLRKERDRGRLVTLLEFSTTYLTAMYIFLLLLLVSGIVLSIIGGFWTSGQLWLWVSLGLLIVLTVAMYYLETFPLTIVRSGLGMQSYQDKKKGIMPTPVSDADLEPLLMAQRPIVGAWLGVIVIVIITALMTLKPF
ncbi:MAG: hypothetical protein ACRDF7_09365 [Candidatus Limnocylindrales bacterium]